MPSTRSAIKRVRSSEKRRVLNRQVRSEARSRIRQARTLIQSGRLDDAQKSVAEAIHVLDKAAEKGILHPNNAARRKSRLMQSLNQALQPTKQ